MKLLKPLLVIVLITGCTVGPDYQAPEPVNYGLPQTGIEVDTQTSMANLSWREYYDEPELQKKGWRKRLALEDLIYFDQWGQRDGDGADSLRQAARESQARVCDGSFLDEL